MKIIPLRFSSRSYSCSAYYIINSKEFTGGYNTLIDVGSDGYIINEIQALTLNKTSSGVDQVILTHNHSDHAGGLAEVLDCFHPRAYAFSPYPGVTNLLKDGDTIKCGDQQFYVLHTPGHSDDSICLYCSNTGALFSGDTSLNILSPSSSYPRDFLTSLELISQLEVKTIYPGHSRPILTDCNKIIKQTLENVRSSNLY